MKTVAALPVSPWSGIGPAASACASDKSIWADRWLMLLAVTLLGYALAGKGFAYIGVPPLFIGEIVLCCGVIMALAFGSWQGLSANALSFGILLVFLVWGALRTLPDLPRYGLETLRDAMTWGYAVFALVVAGLIQAKPERLLTLLRQYGWMAKVFLVCMPVIWVASRMFAFVPTWPWADVPILLPSGGGVLVHCAGILVFGVVGFAGGMGLGRLLSIGFLVTLIGTYERSGLLTFLAIFGFCLLIRPDHSALWSLVGIGAAALLVLLVTGIRVPIPERERELSFDQLAHNLGSVGGTSDAGDLDDTKEWRLNWWADIVEYTVHGKYFWTGKGFGINLTEDDGYLSGDLDPVLRNPHNGHLTLLARGGVPGFALWVLVQLAWVVDLTVAYLRSFLRGEHRWGNLFLFLLAYWIAFSLNASFDVFLEGPMGGIWFWTIYGVGLASVCLYRHNPALLAAMVEETGGGMHFGSG